MEYDISKTVCFTGHRDLPKDIKIRIRHTLPALLDSLCDKGYDTFIAGGALGFDMEAARAVYDLRLRRPNVRLVLAIPCTDQEYDKGWDDNSRAAYYRMRSIADEIVMVTNAPNDHRGRCMHKRNHYMVDHSSLVISYLTVNKGGTLATVNYANKKGVPVIPLAQELNA